jgi:hypothetical protein
MGCVIRKSANPRHTRGQEQPPRLGLRALWLVERLVEFRSWQPSIGT